MATAPPAPAAVQAPPPGRLEVRGPAAGEVEQARRLQREAFPDAPECPAFADAPEELRVLSHEGRVLSCLTLLHGEIHLFGARVSMAGIRKVTTDPAEQGRGHASTLLKQTLASLRDRGVATSILFPFSFRYYRKFGYELGGNHCHVWCRPNALPAYQEDGLARDADAAAAAGALAEFHAASCSGGACCLVRPAGRWPALLQDAELWTVAPDANGALQGYALLRQAADSYGGQVAHVLEMRAAQPAAWRALLGRLARLPVESVEWLSSRADLEASGLLRAAAPLREGFKPRAIVTVRPSFQFRVIDLEAALRARLAGFPLGRYRLALRLQDDLLPENQGGLTIAVESGAARIEPARPEDPTLHADIRVFSQCYTGFLTPGEAVSQGLARLTGPGAEEIAEMLFPRGEPFLSELDRF